MDVRKIQEQAFEFHLALRAWNLHMTSNYDAWGNNFRLNQTFVSFIHKSRIPKTVENHAIKAVIQLENAEIYDYVEFIVVTVEKPTIIITPTLQKRIGDYFTWHNRHVRASTTEDFEIIGSLPRVMHDVHVGAKTGLQAAEEIANAKAWDQLWAMKEQCDFMFEIVWPTIHRYKPLFEE